jgi:hypothetical protein
MKTHDAAQILKRLARMLQAAPNMDLGAAKVIGADVSDGEIAVGLTTLVELARIDKQQWLSFIRQHEFPIKTRPADASRDVLGKLLKYLDQNPDEMKRLKDTANRTSSSPELLRALDALLNG